MSSSLDKNYTVHLAADHAGFEHKEEIKKWLETEGFVVVDHGATEFDPMDDFPDFIAQAAEAVADAPETAKGIIFGGSGQGEAMAANRFKGVRAAVFYGGDERLVELSRQHNDTNVLSIGARFVDMDTTKRTIWTWLHATPLLDEKYTRRNRKLDELH